MYKHFQKVFSKTAALFGRKLSRCGFVKSSSVKRLMKMNGLLSSLRSDGEARINEPHKIIFARQRCMVEAVRMADVLNLPDC